MHSYRCRAILRAPTRAGAPEKGAEPMGCAVKPNMQPDREGPTLIRFPNFAGATAVALSCLAVPATAGGSISSHGFERYGDIFQYVMPLAGAVCAGVRRDVVPYLLRFGGQAVTVEGLKRGLGNAAINQRPNGNSRGFPSGHTAAAFYGASYLAHNCTTSSIGQIAVYGLAAAVGASRVQSNHHTVAQAVAGALVGMMFDTVSVSFSDNRVGLSWRYRF